MKAATSSLACHLMQATSHGHYPPLNPLVMVVWSSWVGRPLGQNRLNTNGVWPKKKPGKKNRHLWRRVATFNWSWKTHLGGGAGFDVKAGVVEENIERFDIKAGVLLALLGEVGPPSGPRGGTGGGGHPVT